MKFAALSWAAATALALACDRPVEERSVEEEPGKEAPQRSAPATIPGEAPEVKLVRCSSSCHRTSAVPSSVAWIAQ